MSSADKMTMDAKVKEMVYDWNDTTKPYRKDVSVAAYWEELVAEQPDAIALECMDEKLTYKELNARVNRLAHTIRAAVGSDIDKALKTRNGECFVALFLNRDTNMIVSILAVLKTGAAYVPLAPASPEERNGMILDDAKPVAILGNKEYEGGIQKITGGATPFLAPEDVDATASSENVVLPRPVQPNDVAYMIYTSGTTGKPKGCMIENINVMHVIVAYASPLMDGVKRTMLFAAYVFDASVSEIFPGLFNKGTIVMATEDVRKDPVALGDFLVEKKIDWATIPPVMAQVMEESKLAVVKKLILAGEAPPLELMQRASKFLTVYNAIGPTECTICSSMHQFVEGDKGNNVGKPISNVACYVLDENLKPVAPGTPGELYIAGAGVGRGYLNRPELNAERFIPNPFGPGRMYKSGDLSTYEPNGDILFLGRIDRQVKIRGYRIELGEIEAQLLELEGIKQAVVIDIKQASGSKMLAAYIVGTLAPSEASKILASKVPDYMVPSVFTPVEEIPLTINGKVDIAKLPAPTEVERTDIVKPTNELEKKICEIWGEVLGMKADNVGITDNFFHCGGDSISCLQVLYRIRKAELGDLRANHLYSAPTIVEFAKLILREQGRAGRPRKDAVEPDQGLVSGEFPHLPIQDWYFNRLDLPKPNHFNQDFTIQLPKDHSYSMDDIKSAAMKLGNHHDMLRCVFKDGHNVCLDEPPVEILDFRNKVLDKADKDKFQSSLDIANGPVWRVVLHSGYKLWFLFHHLLIDVVSWRIISEDVHTIMTGGTLSSKTCSYKQWIEYVRSYAQSKGKEQMSLWKNMHKEALHPKLESVRKSPAMLKVTVDQAHTAKLIKDAHSAYNTEINDLLVAALNLAMSQTTGSSTNTVNLEGIGRISEDVDVSRTVGWFTILYPAKLDSQGGLEDVIIKTKELLRSVPDKGLGYGALTQSNLVEDRLSRVVFNYLGQLGSTAADWAILVDESGEDVGSGNHDPRFSMEINGAVDMAKGELFFDVMSWMDQSSAETFCMALEKAIVDIVDHASAVKEPVKTPSDYMVPKLTLPVLRDIEDKYSSYGGVEALYSATSMQEAFVAHAVTHPEDDAYTLQMLFDFDGKFDDRAYQKAWGAVIRRYPSMRCAFHWHGTGAVMVVVKQLDAPDVEVHDLRGKSSQWEKIKAADRSTGFDLGYPGLIRMKAAQIADDKWKLIVSVHHAVVDGWSQPFLQSEISAAYDSYVASGNYEDKKKDEAFFAAHEYRMQTMEETKEYWEDFQLEAPDDLSMILNRAYTEAGNSAVVTQPAEDTVTMSPEMTMRLREMCREQGVTMNAAVQFAWHKLLQIYSGESETCVGTTVSGRDVPVEGLGESVGMYINTLPLLLKWKDSATATEILKQCQEKIGDLGTYSQMSLAELASRVGQNPFMTVSVYDSFADDVNAQGKDDKFKLETVVEKLDLPLGLTAADENGQLNLILMYNLAWLSRERAFEHLHQLRRMLEFIVERPDAPHEEVAVAAMSESERRMVLDDWNQTDRPWRQDITAHRMFEENVLKQPDEIALIFKDEQVSYREMNERANRLARKIRKLVGPEIDNSPNPFIALLLERNLNTVISVMAVLKAGAAYVPLSPKHPDERIRSVFEDATPVAVLTNECHMEKLRPLATFPIVNVEDVDPAISSKNIDEVNRTPDDLAYLLYTSGTTGKPKGCMLEHKNLLQLVQQHAAWHDNTGVKRILFFAAYVFDDSVYEMFVTLLTGYTLVITPEEIRTDIVELGKFLIEQKIDWGQMTPALAQVMDVKSFANFKWMVVGGEAPSLDLLTRVSKVTDIFNTTGPTECTVNCASHMFVAGDPANIIGKALANGKLYVLDQNMNPVPVGAPGELCVGGAGVGRGYYNRDELTKDRYLPNPYAPGTIYRTGDKVRFLENGDLQFFGRMDRQVKIRGFRIELGEIEAQINSLDGVKQAVVIDVKVGSKSKALAAYIVGTASVQSIRGRLESTVPDYMVPSSFTFIEKVPLNINGKLDRKQLPQPDLDIEEREIVPPRNEDEQAMKDIWTSILGIEEISIFDNFHALGGTSIQVAQLVALTNGRVTFKSIHSQRTLADLVNATSEATEKIIEPRPGAENLSPAPLSSGQKRLFVMDSLDSATSLAYHFPWIAQLTDDADIDKLKQSLFRVVKRNHVLRTVYRENENGTPMQVILGPELLDISEVTLDSDEELKERIDEDTRVPFDLRNDLPTKAIIYEQDGIKTVLVLLHHIAFDGWSLDVFLKEWSELYAGEHLEPVRLQYADYAVWEQDHLKDISQDLKFWKENLVGIKPVQLLKEKEETAVATPEGGQVVFKLNKKLSDQLRALARQTEKTMYTITLTAFFALLARSSGQDDIVLASPVADRPSSDTQHMIGFFVNMIALRAKVDPSMSLNDLLQIVGDTIVPNAMSHSHVPFDKVVQHALKGDRPYGSTPPHFQIQFSVQGFEGYQSSGSLPLTKPPDDLLGFSPSKVELMMMLNDEGSEVIGDVVFAPNVYSQKYVEHLVQRYELFLEALVSSSAEPIMNANIISPEEQRLLVDSGWGMDLKPEDQRSLGEMFQGTVANNPNGAALVYGNATMTYTDLNRRSNELATRIRQKLEGTQVRNELVGLYFDKGIDMAVAILAVLKAGAAYVPLSPGWSAETVDFVLTDCQAKLVVAQSDIIDNVKSENKLDIAASPGTDFGAFDTNLTSLSGKEDLACALYTSGMNGEKPHAVLQTHENFVRLVVELNSSDVSTLSSTDKIMQCHEYQFEASILEFWACMACGATLVIPEAGCMNDLDALASLCDHEKVTVLSSTPSAFERLLPCLTFGFLEELNCVFLSGEELTDMQVSTFSEVVGGDSKTKMIMMYGSIETGVCSFWKAIDAAYTVNMPGRSLGDQRCFVLDANMKLAPVGAYGEIFIGGAGLAKGYLNNDYLTQARFVPNPFASEADKVRGWNSLFKTGRQGRWTNTGELELQGADVESRTFWAATPIAEPNDLRYMLNEAYASAIVKTTNEPLETTSVDIDLNTMGSLKSVLSENGLTMEAAVSFAWHKLIQIYTNDDETVVGLTILGREMQGDGMNKNSSVPVDTLPFNVQWDANTTALGMLNKIQAQVSGLVSNNQIGLPDVVKMHGGDSQFNTVLVYEKFPGAVGDRKLNLTADLGSEKINLPLGLFVVESTKTLQLKMMHQESWLSPDEATKLLDQMRRIMQHLGENPSGSQKETESVVISEIEKKQVLYDFNQTVTPFRDDIAAHRAFEEAAAATPDAIAVEFGDEKITFGDLNSRANQMARMIRDRVGSQIDADEHKFVALYLDRNIDMVTAIFATTKAGASYIPILPDNAVDRAQMILEDSSPLLVVTTDNFVERLSGMTDSPTYSIDNIDSSLPDSNLDVKTKPTDLVYAIYTSGTTGKPKGCMVTHRNLMHVVRLSEPLVLRDDIKKGMGFASYSFDMSILDIWINLVFGKAVYILSEQERKDPEAIGEIIEKHKIDWTIITPVFANLIDVDKLRLLKVALIGGESPPQELLDNLCEHVETYNVTGPTESSVICSKHRFRPGDHYSNVGAPLENVRLYVLNEAKKPVPVGALGELYVGGPGITNGYLNRPELTASKFTDNPFDEGRMYQSGDIVRWYPNGEIQFIGRADAQVKIRGYRIELGEIQTRLQEVEGVEMAVVVDMKRDGRKFLAAYVVGNVNKATILEAVKDRLPSYMIPSTFNFIDTVPFTFNGKVDRRALPEPDWEGASDDGSQSSGQMVRARTELEKRLCQIWIDVLGVKAVGITDNFFHRGGDSITCLQVLYKIRQAGLGDLKARDIYKAPTVQGLSQIIEQSGSSSDNAFNKADQGQMTGTFAMLPVQDEFFDLGLKFPNHFNQAFTIKLPAGHSVDAGALEKLVVNLAHQHDILRCTFKDKMHVCGEKANAEIINMGDKVAVEGELTKLHASMSIEEGPLWRMVLHSGNQLWLAFHQLIVDAQSLRILSEDIQSVLSGKTLGAKTCSYKQWVQNVEHFYGKKGKAQATIWKKMKGGNNPSLMPTLSKSTMTKAIVSSATTDRLLSVANKAYNTQVNDLLLAALAQALAKTTGSRRNKIALKVAGRKNGDIDVSRTIGCFTQTCPVQFSAADDLGDLIVEAKEAFNVIPDNGIAYGLNVQAGNIVEEEVAPVVFNYVGQFGAAGEPEWSIMTSAENGEAIAPENVNTGVGLSVVGFVNGVSGQLEIEISSLIDQGMTEKIKVTLEKSIEEIVEYACGIKEPIMTPSDYCVPGLTVDRLKSLEKTFKDVGGFDALYPATSLQTSFVAHAITSPDDDAYTTQIWLDFEGDLDVASLEKAWERVTKQYPTYRSVFDWYGDGILLVILKNIKGPAIDVFDIRDGSKTAEEIRQLDQSTSYDLAKAPLVRLKAIHVNDDQWSLLFSFHHAILDGWSIPITFQAMTDAYLEITGQGETTDLVEDTAFFRAHECRIQSVDESRDYWSQVKLGRANDIGHFMNEAYAAAEFKNVIDSPAETIMALEPALKTRLESILGKNGITMNIAVNFAWHKLIQLYTQDDTTIVGVTASGREMILEGLDRSVGMYINTLPYKTEWISGVSSIEMLKRMQVRMGDLTSHAQIPLEDIVKMNGGEKPFSTVLVYENYPESDVEKRELFTTRDGYGKLDLALGLIAYEFGGGLQFHMMHNGTWLSSEKANHLLNQMVRILDHVAHEPMAKHEDAGRAAFTESEYRRMEGMSYWKTHLAGAEPVDIPSDAAKAAASDDGTEASVNISDELARGLRQLVNETGTSMHDVTLAAYYTLLARFSSQDDLMVGSPVPAHHSIRRHSIQGHESVNSVALRTKYDETWTIRDLIKHVHEHVTSKAMAHSHISFDEVIKECIDYDASQGLIPPHFQVRFAFSEGGEAIVAEGTPTAKFDIALSLNDGESGISARFVLRLNKYTPEFAQCLANQFNLILEDFVGQPGTQLVDMRLTTEEERKLTIDTWNQTAMPYDVLTIHDSFQRVVEKTPDAIAVDYKDEQVTYAELNSRANRLARMIRAMAGWKFQPGKETYVVLYLNRNTDLIVSLLAVFKSGAAYVPIVPDKADDRTTMILEDTDPALVLTNMEHVDKLQNLAKSPVLAVETVHPAIPSNNLDEVQVKPDDVAYVLFTSGTTGKPKGCMMEHRNVQYIATDLGAVHESEDVKRTLFFAAYNFDASIGEIFPSLIHGRTIVIAHDEARKDSIELGNLIVNKNVHWIFMTPAIAQLIDEEKFAGVKSVDIGGEAPHLDIFERLSKYTKPKQVIGPTESCVYCARKDYTPGVLVNNIGKPLLNATCYIVNKKGAPVPLGAPGELCVGGKGVGRGYLGREELTKEKFIDNPFHEGRLYKTGDRVRWMPSGDMQFLGRLDRQVKIRGFRIELEEIEVAMKSIEGIEQAVVVAIKQGNNKVLAAYAVGSVDFSTIAAKLGERLPQYMVPLSFTKMESIPTTVSGKVDKRALPAPEMEKTVGTVVEAENDLQSQLCEIWAAVLNQDEVGIKDNFFHRGGDSITCLQVLHKIRSAGLAELRAKDFYANPTIESLGRLIESRKGSTMAGFVKPDQGPIVGAFGFLPVQEYFYRMNLAKPNHFNQEFTVLLPDNHGVDESKLKEMATKLAQQHDILRCIYKNQQQFCQEEAPVEVKDMGDSIADESMLTGFQAALDLENGPTWRVVRHSGKKLWFVFHHMIIDVVSWRILTEDVKSILTGQSLGPKTCSYKQWVNHIKEYADKQREKQVPFWNNMKPNANKLVFAPERKEALIQDIKLGSDLTTKLLTDAHKAYNTEINDLLLAAVARALTAVTQDDLNSITLEGIGRISDEVDLSRTVGWFTNIYPISLDGGMDADIGEVIVNTKEILRSIPNKGIGFGALVQSGDILDDLAPVSFNYLGQLGGESSGGSQEWSIAVGEVGGKELAPENSNSRFTLDVNGHVNSATGELAMDITSHLSEEKTTAFCSALETALVQVIEHTSSIDQPRKTPSDYTIPNLTMEWLQDIESKFQNQDIEGMYVATGLQQAFLAHYASHPDDDAYAVQILMDCVGEFDMAAYQKAWDYTIRKFPSLRSAYHWDGPTPVMIILKEVPPIKFEVEDIAGTGKTAQQLASEDRAMVVDLSKPCPLRVKIIKEDGGKTAVLINAHHILMDGWSMGPFLESLNEGYLGAKKNGKTPELVQDAGFFAGCEYRQQSLPEAQEYWKSVELGSANQLNFMLNDAFSEAKSTTYLDQPTDIEVEMDVETTALLKQTCRDNGVTLNAAIQFAWHKLLQIYTADEETIVGTVSSGRDMPVEGINSSVGLYINTLPLILRWERGASTLDMLKQANDRVVEMGSYSQVALREIIAHQGEATLFHTVSVFENYPEGDGETDDAFEIRDSVEKLDVPLGFVGFEHEGKVGLKLKYNKTWLSDDRATELLNQCIRILAFVGHHVESPHEQVVSMVMSEEERNMVLTDWNQTAAFLRDDITIHRRFEEVAAANPDKICIEYKDEKLTYKEVNERANRMALTIRMMVGPKLDADRDSFIALYLDRDTNMLVSILAVLKAGAAYCPIAPDKATDRGQMILEDADPAAILANQHYMERLQGLSKAPVLAVESIQPMFPSGNLAFVDRSPTDLAYMIFTSGTTGKPKGCMLEHRNVFYLVEGQNPLTNDEGEKAERALLFAAYVFDASVIELYWNLFNGATVILAPEELRKDATGLGDFLVEQKIDWAVLTPILAGVVEPTKYAGLKGVILGGEAPTLELLQNMSKYTNVFNGMGPTECTVCNAANKFENGDQANNIGKPLANSTAYVLNEDKLPVPLGAPGEMYIGGHGVGRGYLRRPQLNEERFIPNPFGPGRLYKSGDAVRFLPNGDMQFLGRTDRQVKIRGFRIEIGEVEAAIEGLDGIKQAAVIDIPKGRTKALVGYVVGDLDAKTIGGMLSNRLPDYMIPSIIMAIDSIPMTINGKLDRTKLPEPKLEKTVVAVEPKTPLEKQLCEIFAQVLDLEAVGTTDNFYECGGNSISALDLVFKLSSVGVGSFKAKDILECPTVRAILDSVGDPTAEEEESQDELPELPQNIGGARGSISRRQSRSKRERRTAPGRGAGMNRQLSKQKSILKKYGSSRSLGGPPRSVSVAPVQSDMLPMQEWLVDLCEQKRAPAVLACTVSLPAEQNITAKDIEKALQELALSHEVLRASIDGKNLTIQENDSPIGIVDMGKSKVNDLTFKGICSSLNVKGGLLWRAALHSQNQLFLAFHPVIMDMHSMGVFVDELVLLLRNKTVSHESCTFRKWMEYVADSAQFNGLIHGPFWDKMQSSSSENFKMEQEKPLCSQLKLSDETVSSLLTDSKSSDKTSARTLVLAAVARALSQVAGNLSNSIFTTSPGRVEQDIDVSRSVGVYQTMFPVLLDGTGEMTKLVNRTSRTLGVIPEQGLSYMSLVRDGQVKTITPQVFVNYRDMVVNVTSEWPVTPFGNDTNKPFDAGVPLTVDSFVDPKRGTLVFNITSYLSMKVTDEFERALQHAVDSVSEYIKLNCSGSSPTSGPGSRGGRASSRGGRGLAKQSSIRASRLIRTYHKSLAEFTYIFLIHPGGSDAAVYKPLATKLYESGFNPKGVDNDVIMSMKKYDMARDLFKLGKHYRDTILKNMKKAPEGAPIVILGWSLGGKIALEVAAQLEKDGFKNIFCYILDSYWKVTMLGADMESFVDYNMKLYHEERGGKVDKTLEAAHKHVVESEYVLADADLSGFLRHTRVTLFKAGKIMAAYDDLQLSRIQLESFDNGLNNCAAKVKVVLMEDHDHSTLIGEDEEIVDTIVDEVSDFNRTFMAYSGAETHGKHNKKPSI